MILHNCVQGTEEWLQLRAGIPTASQFDKIITPKTRVLSKQADAYLYKLLAERLLGRYLEDTKSFFWAERGKQLEAEAVAYYEAQREVDTAPVGFITTDDGLVGASPDRLVGDDGLLEIKCPSPQVHMSYMLDEPVSADYWLQVQGQLWISEREWCDVVSYHDELPPIISRVHRVPETIIMLQDAIGHLVSRLEALTVKMRERQGQPASDVLVMSG